MWETPKKNPLVVSNKQSTLNMKDTRGGRQQGWGGLKSPQISLFSWWIW
jgi:hypothetical protein